MESSNRSSAVPGGGDTSERRLPEGRDQTQYVILQRGENGGYWPVADTDQDDKHIEGSSAKAAINAYLNEYVEGEDEADPTGWVFVAVPARSWKPVPVGGVEEVPAKRQFKLG